MPGPSSLRPSLSLWLSQACASSPWESTSILLPCTGAWWSAAAVLCRAYCSGFCGYWLHHAAGLGLWGSVLQPSVPCSQGLCHPLGDTTARRWPTTRITSAYSIWWRASFTIVPASWRTSWRRTSRPRRPRSRSKTWCMASCTSSSPAIMCWACPSPSGATTAPGKSSRTTGPSTASTACPARKVSIIALMWV